MTTGLISTSGQDFEELFEAGSGNQLLYIYADDGQDIGQKFLPASQGEPGDATGFFNDTNTDVGPLLCAKGSNNIFTLEIVSSDSYCCRHDSETGRCTMSGYLSGSCISTNTQWYNRTGSLKGSISPNVLGNDVIVAMYEGHGDKNGCGIRDGAYVEFESAPSDTRAIRLTYVSDGASRTVYRRSDRMWTSGSTNGFLNRIGTHRIKVERV